MENKILVGLTSTEDSINADVFGILLSQIACEVYLKYYCLVCIGIHSLC